MLAGAVPFMNSELPIFRVDDLAISFGSGARRARVVDGVSFHVGRGETLGIVGESGCGKSVTVMSSVGLQPSPPSHVDGGSARLGDVDLLALRPKALRRLWGSRIGVVFQDPMTSLNPVFTIGMQLREALAAHTNLPDAERETRIMAMLARVGINAPERRLRQYPHELSGGQKQRVAIARALAVAPQLLILDEPTSALDVSVQARVMDLLVDLGRQLDLTYLFISHDLSLMRNFADTVGVLYLGKIVETGPTAAVFESAQHDYTRLLLASVPVISAEEEAMRPKIPLIDGEIPTAEQLIALRAGAAPVSQRTEK